MSYNLDEIEVRILGSLVEKELTTPDSYPLTLRALTNACNQRSNRYPVVNYSTDEIENALDRLNKEHLVYLFYGSTSRVVKYKHRIPKIYELDTPETAVISVLMLRGFQTIGELNQRTVRYYRFSSLDEIEQTLIGLTQREQPLVVKLPIQPGHKEARYAHLLSGEIDPNDIEIPKTSSPNRNQKLETLEQEVSELRIEMMRLREDFDAFKGEFE